MVGKAQQRQTHAPSRGAEEEQRSTAAVAITYLVLGDCTPCLPMKGETKAVAELRHISEISPRATMVK